MNNCQRGVGLIEVLVALLLLAVAVLGFSAMQMTAVKATDESLMRTRALSVLQNAAETMRANPSGISAFKTALNTTSDSINNADTSNVSITVKNFATNNDLSVGMATCPQTSATSGVSRQCLIASWGDTDPILLSTAVPSDTTKDKPCANDNAVYNTGASCFIMEAY